MELILGKDNIKIGAGLWGNIGLEQNKQST